MSRRFSAMQARAGLVALATLVMGSAIAQPPAAAIASAHPLATAAGEEILNAGGNAFDAAIAVAATLAVAEPSGSGLGGGGFFLLHEAKTGRKVFVDAREVAPEKALPDMYLKPDGELDRGKLRTGPLAAGIPGLPAALVHLAKTRGELSLARNLEPAIRAAKDGFIVDEPMARRLQFRASELEQFPSSKALFFREDRILKSGEKIRQPDLARTLTKLATFGREGFYAGPVADELLRSVTAAGGIWTARDLNQYRVIERLPVVINYADWQIVSAPPPSSGGLVLAEIFNMLGILGDKALRGRSDRAHTLVELMRRAYYDRARYMGDADFVPVPSQQLLSREHAEKWLQSYSPRQATPSAELAPEAIASVGVGVDTTHFSVLDHAGNRVAATLSINFPFGAAFVAGRTGVMLNNEMDDFVAQVGVPNGYGLVGGEANKIEPGKRMLSSMTPTFLEGESRTAIVGTPGGSRIITMVLLAVLELMEGASAEQTVALPRFHHQYLPDEIQFEPAALDASMQKSLARRGHTLSPRTSPYGNMQVVVWDHGQQVTAASDPRGIGAARVIEARAPAQPPQLLLDPR